MTELNSEKSVTQPQVYKQNELKLFIELVEAGLWRNTNLAKALNIDVDTVADWKKRPEVQEAYRKTILKLVKVRPDIEKILKEMAIESDPDTMTLGLGVDANGKPISAFAFVFGTEYDPLSRSKSITATSETSPLRESTAIQDADLAPQGTQDNHGNLPDGTASTP